MPIWRSQVIINSPYIGGLGTNTWHARTESATPGVDIGLVALQTALEAFYFSIASVFASTTTLTHDGAWVRQDDDPIVHSGGDPWTVSSGGSGNPQSTATAMVVSWKTEQASRRARGRTFLSPLSVGVLQDNGTPLEATRTAVQEAGQLLIDSFDGPGDGALGVWSANSEGNPPAFFDHVACAVANKFAVLRSRRD